MLYIARIELQNGGLMDFQRLHKIMYDHGFAQTIGTVSGEEYHLPRATYSIESTVQILEIVNHIGKIVALIGRSAEVLVSQGEVAFLGLKPIV